MSTSYITRQAMNLNELSLRLLDADWTPCGDGSIIEAGKPFPDFQSPDGAILAVFELYLCSDKKHRPGFTLEADDIEQALDDLADVGLPVWSTYCEERSELVYW